MKQFTLFSLTFLMLFEINWARPQFFEPMSEGFQQSRHHHRRHPGMPFGSMNGFNGNFGSLFSGGGPATGLGSANAGNGAHANGIGVAQAPPGGIGLALGLGLALETPFGNIALSEGDGFSMG